MPQRTRVPTTGDAAPTHDPADPSPAPAHTSTRPSRAPRKRPANGASPPAPAADQRSPQRVSSPDLPTGLAATGPEELARALRAMAVELERDPTLAQRISEAMRDLPPQPPSLGGKEETAAGRRPAPPASRGGKDETVLGGKAPKGAARPFRPRVVEGASPDLGPGIPDPFALRARQGEAGLRRALDDLRLGTLRAIVREHRLDPDGAAIRGNDAERLRALILQQTSQPARERRDTHA